MANTEDIIKKHFRSSGEAQRALGVTRQTLYNWRKSGIPPLRQSQIELWILKNAADAAATGESPPQKASLPAE